MQNPTFAALDEQWAVIVNDVGQLLVGQQEHTEIIQQLQLGQRPGPKAHRPLRPDILDYLGGI